MVLGQLNHIPSPKSSCEPYRCNPLLTHLLGFVLSFALSFASTSASTSTLARWPPATHVNARKNCNAVHSVDAIGTSASFQHRLHTPQVPSDNRHEKRRPVRTKIPIIEVNCEEAWKLRGTCRKYQYAAL
ncbi:hypothetical protein BU23DRAFT_556065 [Bimuria novae-zelandiae CBS 107.79]|uniref:Uncharacterized protein n=1 Tax=Bimuria novae-zelandiae CBS 107.79 TaxID=1447943 RepID=A0A6A5V1Y0_9PLEO|nr:hypothetical protein BU23DRAFT_556065 [Bimuria novae-zelandiae CBS 107.79]